MSHMTRTPLARSNGQMSTCMGRGHIVAASRTACFRCLDDLTGTLHVFRSSCHHNLNILSSRKIQNGVIVVPA